MKKSQITITSLAIVTILMIGYILYITNNNQKLTADSELKILDLQDQLETLEASNQELMTAMSEKEDSLSTKTQQLEDLRDDLQDLEAELEDEESRLNPIKSALSRVAQDVATQRKLEAIDAELLQKYSNVYFLNENYIPDELASIPSKFTIKDEVFHARALPFLTSLLEAAEADSIDLSVTSAYRSFNRQAELKSQYVQTYGSGANTFSADQGYSEHQLGTTIDFVSNENGNNLSGFESTKAYEWLQQNAHKFGFTLSYPDDNQYYQFEPWHWRFVGTELADTLDDNNEFLYDLSERELQEYRLELFD